MSLLKGLKRSSLHLCKNLGVYHLSRNSPWRAQRLLILCYHYVSLENEHEWSPTMFMKPADFEGRLKMLQEGRYRVLPLNDALERLYRNDLPERSVAITFDDGGYDFYKQAYPLLKRYGFPATVYLTTYYSDYNKPIFGLMCHYLLWMKRGAIVDGESVIGSKFRMDLTSEDGRRRAHDRIAGFATDNRLSAPQKNELAERLASCLGIDYENLLAKRILHLMNNEEVAELAANGVDFQLHTHRHRTPVDRFLYIKEILDNRVRIEALTGSQAVHFCYPSGVYRPQFLPWLNEARVTSATTCNPGIASRRTNALLLPRLVDHGGLDPIEFEGWLTGVASFLPGKRVYQGHIEEVAETGERVSPALPHRV